jgi:hypothetical protein
MTNNEKTHEAIVVIKMNQDAKSQNENVFFKQIIEKFPESMDLFHEKLNELLNSQSWCEKPIFKKKILVSFEFLIYYSIIKTF